MSPQPFSGPIACINEPKKNIATMKLIDTVHVIITANFLKVTISPGNKNTPEPNVVKQPLKILTPIYS